MRIAPLSGLLAVAMTVVAFLLLGDTPDIDTPGRQVGSYYDAHQGRTYVSLYLLVLAGALFVFFAAYLARVVRSTPSSVDWLRRVVLAGGVLIAAGFWTGAAITLALADLSDKSSAGRDSLQALNALNEDFFIPFVGGMGLLLLAAGLATVRAATSALPRWLGWAGIVVGVLVFIPWVGFFAFMLSGLWVIVTSVLLARRPHADTPADVATPPLSPL